MATTDLDSLGTWHELLDALCQQAGHHDNAALASAYCQQVGKNAQDDFEAIQKNLRNWRIGRHVPLRRNAIVLARLLGVDADPALRRRWLALHAEARGVAGPVPPQERSGKVGPETWAETSGHRRFWKSTAIAVAASVAAVGTTAGYNHWRFMQLPLIGYDARVKMVVGETRLIHGDFASCGSTPPDWYYLLGRVPISALGEFSDGGIARKMSNDCNRVVAVRAVRFTARQSGSEEVTLLGDFMKVEVTELGYARPE